VDRCRKRSCTIIVPPINTVIIDCDRCDAFQQDERRPDFIVFYDDISNHRQWWLIVEIKGRLKSAKNVLQQLESGASVIEHHRLYHLPQVRSRYLIPLTLFDGQTRAEDFTLYDRKRIRFFGENYPAIAMRCRPGLRLQDLIPRIS
jgi:hypothetical protein